MTRAIASLLLLVVLCVAGASTSSCEERGLPPGYTSLLAIDQHALSINVPLQWPADVVEQLFRDWIADHGSARLVEQTGVCRNNPNFTSSNNSSCDSYQAQDCQSISQHELLQCPQTCGLCCSCGTILWITHPVSPQLTIGSSPNTIEVDFIALSACEGRQVSSRATFSYQHTRTTTSPTSGHPTASPTPYPSRISTQSTRTSTAVTSTSTTKPITYKSDSSESSDDVWWIVTPMYLVAAIGFAIVCYARGKCTKRNRQKVYAPDNDASNSNNPEDIAAEETWFTDGKRKSWVDSVVNSADDAVTQWLRDGSGKNKSEVTLRQSLKGEFLFTVQDLDGAAQTDDDELLNDIYDNSDAVCTSNLLDSTRATSSGHNRPPSYLVPRIDSDASSRPVSYCAPDRVPSYCIPSTALMNPDYDEIKSPEYDIATYRDSLFDIPTPMLNSPSVDKIFSLPTSPKTPFATSTIPFGIQDSVFHSQTDTDSTFQLSRRDTTHSLTSASMQYASAASINPTAPYAQIDHAVAAAVRGVDVDYCVARAIKDVDHEVYDTALNEEAPNYEYAEEFMGSNYATATLHVSDKTKQKPKRRQPAPIAFTESSQSQL